MNGPQGQLKEELRSHFYNISRIIDCVGCDKCRLHGKLQIYGIGTALRFLFSDVHDVQRNELVAFVNTLAKFSRAERIMQGNIETMVWSKADCWRSRSAGGRPFHMGDISIGKASALTQVIFNKKTLILQYRSFSVQRIAPGVIWFSA